MVACRYDMLMTNENVKLTIYDPILAKTILVLIPQWIKPNHFTIARICITPGVLYAIWSGNWTWSISLFLLAAATDFIDGSLARTRKQITMWGTIADPVADKILISTAVIVFVAREINPIFSLIIITLEILISLTNLYRKLNGSMISANWAGKTKMFLQCVGVLGLFCAKLFDIDLFVPFSIGTFSLAIVFAIISLVTYGF
ncbi:CDP-alcohol phosphatidyltransferase family protein [Candidatus Uhrbacteria bacterium]|nr:CDP-alcohol phosphatidyltransferase family protein [Candidatus Uhrbacteria bacterium]